MIKTVWVPPKNYAFPLLDVNKKRGLRFQAKWLDQYPWLTYSKEKLGAFCKPCVIFSKTGGSGHQPLGLFVVHAYSYFAKAQSVNPFCF